MNAITRRLRKLEDIRTRRQAEQRLNPAWQIAESRRTRLIAEGRDPGPDLPVERYIDFDTPLLLDADVMARARARQLAQSAEPD
jgi:hypothetical protein